MHIKHLMIIKFTIFWAFFLFLANTQASLFSSTQQGLDDSDPSNGVRVPLGPKSLQYCDMASLIPHRARGYAGMQVLWRITRSIVSLWWCCPMKPNWEEPV